MKTSIDRQAKTLSNSRFIFIIFCLALITGIIAINVNDPQSLGPDSTGYINYAVNIIKNGVYSPLENPQEDNYFREPGYPYFLAGILSLYSIGGKVEYIRDYDLPSRRLSEYREDIQFIRYSQLLIVVITLMLFYGFLLIISSKFVARATIIVCSIYYPLIVYSVLIIREPLLLFLFTTYVYTFALYCTRGKQGFLVVSSLAIALASLTFQVMLVFLPITVFLIIIRPGQIKWNRKIIEMTIVTIVYVGSLSPWLVRVYQYYPDVRVCKTLGCSLTHESTKYIGSIRLAAKQGLISSEDLSSLEHENWYQLSSKDIYERSFQGWYLQEAGRWNAKTTPIKNKSMRRVRKYYSYFIRNWLKHNWSPLSLKEAKSSGNYLAMMPFMMSLLIGATSIIGLLLFLVKEKAFLLMPYMFYLIGTVTFFGSERRRSLPILPLIIFFFTYFLFTLLKHVKFTPDIEVSRS